MLEVKNLKIEFMTDALPVTAVDGIDFTINENEVVGLVGASGSGKTVTALSLMKLLSKSESSVSGEVIFSSSSGEKKDLFLLNDDEIRKIRGAQIAMIFQEPFTSLNPVLSIGEQIEEVMWIHQKTSRKDLKFRALELLKKVRITDPERVYSGYSHQLSGGERQRIMIAMAIAINPRLLIADEPTTALDVTIQAEILDLILKLKEELGMSVFFITHDFDIIKRIADRVLVMKNGKIVEEGKKDDLLRAPKDPYTKRLIDAIPKINLVRGEVLKDAKRQQAIMTVKNLNKSFSVEKGIFKKKTKGTEAVKNVSFQIEKSKTLGLVGASGSGKTTVAKLLVGLLNADSGKIESDKSISDIQIIFQDPYDSLDPCMKMRDIVLEGLKVRGVRSREKKQILKDVLFKVHLSYRDRLKYPHQFSGGERQRIAIARAIAIKPQVLILDEPVSSLDVIIQSEILKLLKELQKELALTYVFISHDLRVVEYMSDEVAVMQNGEIVELASKDEIYFSPKHPYTKCLLSSVFETEPDYDQRESHDQRKG